MVTNKSPTTVTTEVTTAATKEDSDECVSIDFNAFTIYIILFTTIIYIIAVLNSCHPLMTYSACACLTVDRIVHTTITHLFRLGVNR